MYYIALTSDDINTLCSNPENIYLFKVNDRNFRKWCKICSKFVNLKTPERRHQSSDFSQQLESDTAFESEERGLDFFR